MTTQLPIPKERLEQIANFHSSMVLPPSHDEIEAMARALLAAYEQEPVAWIIEDEVNGIPQHISTVKEYALAYPERKVTPLYTHPAPVPSVPDEIVGWVREVTGDSRDPLFLCGRVSPYVGKAYNSQYFPVKRAAMLNGGKS